ncbi:hypothetical protein FA13DRAFT_1777186 [Coprinellus micaceus]|uniref:Uncharacterized protein n=1 Tax=Coprinellus micaceus TaxID=71717 RepID=A0A4Y7SWF8_COPMI|nr:hypothetical protein FA13DRAFT_1777186 [Coprinellus micaceus]
MPAHLSRTLVDTWDLQLATSWPCIRGRWVEKIFCRTCHPTANSIPLDCTRVREAVGRSSSFERCWLGHLYYIGMVEGLNKALDVAAQKGCLTFDVGSTVLSFALNGAKGLVGSRGDRDAIEETRVRRLEADSKNDSECSTKSWDDGSNWQGADVTKA